MNKRYLCLIVSLCLLVPAFFSAEISVPAAKPGELVYIPYPVKIIVDGKTDDWESIPHFTVTDGPYTSGDLSDNGQFTWGICADMKNLYIHMTMPDKKIIAGRHGQDFWNEDSFEFYFNLSGNLDAVSYGPGIVQANINATNIGKNDPENLSLTGVRFAEEGYDVSGYAFKVEGGWSVELAIKLDNNIEPYHGFTIGMQFQANGAVIKDRDSKLIWSLYDTSDNSWKNPKLFGTGVFYKLGSTDVPEPSRKNLPKIIARKTIPLDKLPKVRVNQHGYLPKSVKWATVVTEAEESLNWELVNAESKTVASGKTIPLGLDLTSRDLMHQINFSAFTGEGADFILKVDGLESFPFDIRKDLYNSLTKDAMAYFYRSRAGIALDPKLAGEKWAHGAWYVSDNAVEPFPKRDYILNAGKGWFDAGDYGKYVVNAGISVWTLMNLYERNPSQLRELPIPESGNNIPDILNEVRWELDFMMGMQVPEGHDQAGMVHHKLHEHTWSPLPYTPAERVTDRFAYTPSTAATLNLAAAAAQMSRLIAPFDAAYAETCLIAAERAWKAAKENPEFKYGNIPGDGGGNYDDFYLEDEYYWAACELFVTTGKAEYEKSLIKSLDDDKIIGASKAPNGPMYWGGVATLGHLSMTLNAKKVDKATRQKISSLILSGAERYRKQITDEGYLVPMFEYEWGSTSSVLNKLILMAYAYDATGNRAYLDGLTMSMDYLLGRNALCKSFITGYGENPMFYPHHRYWVDEEDAGYPPPPPGVISGGPNEGASDEATAFMVVKNARSKRYADDVRSYSTNEVTINWNSPLVWVSAYLDEVYNPDSGVKRVGKSPVSAIRIAVAAIALVILSGLSAVFFRRKNKNK